MAEEKSAEEAASTLECNLQQRMVNRKSPFRRAAIYHSKSFASFRLKEQISFSLYYFINTRGCVGRWAAPAHTYVLPELFLSNSIADKLAPMFTAGFRSMLHMSLTSTCSVLKGHLDAAAKAPKSWTYGGLAGPYEGDFSLASLLSAVWAQPPPSVFWEGWHLQLTPEGI